MPSLYSITPLVIVIVHCFGSLFSSVATVSNIVIESKVELWTSVCNWTKEASTASNEASTAWNEASKTACEIPPAALIAGFLITEVGITSTLIFLGILSAFGVLFYYVALKLLPVGLLE